MDFTCLPIDACYRHRETLQSILYRIISQNLSELGTLTSGLRGFIHEVEHLFIFGTKKQWRSTICPWCLWKKIKCPTAFISSASMQRKPRLTSWKLSHIFATFIRIRCISCMCIYIWTIIYTYIHTLHYITLHSIPLRYITLHHITLHYITLHTYILCNMYMHIQPHLSHATQICYSAVLVSWVKRRSSRPSCHPKSRELTGSGLNDYEYLMYLCICVEMYS